MGGEIMAASIVGEGSRISFDLPFERVPEKRGDLAFEAGQLVYVSRRAAQDDPVATALQSWNMTPFTTTEAGVSGRLDELDRGFRALEELRAAGTIGGIGAGINETGMIPRFLERFDLDFFLVAMPYNLLTHDAAHEELPACAARGVGVVIGAPFASGILATGPGDAGAMFNYAPAGAGVLDKARRMDAVCGRHGVPLKAAALQFPLGHASVAAVIPGAVSPEQVRENIELLRRPIPGELWAELKAEGLIPPEAATP